MEYFEFFVECFSTPEGVVRGTFGLVCALFLGFYLIKK